MFLGEKQQAAFLTLIASSQVADAALLPLGTEGEMLEGLTQREERECWSRSDLWERGSD